MKIILIIVFSAVLCFAGNYSTKYPMPPTTDSELIDIDLFPYWCLPKEKQVAWTKIFAKDFWSSIRTRTDGTGAEYLQVATIMKSQYSRTYLLYTYFRAPGSQWSIGSVREVVTQKQGEFFLPK